MNEFDILIIGLGPSGLFFCSELFRNVEKGRSLKVCGIDAGTLLPNRSRYSEV
jgi:hypothetical protein